MSFIIQLMETLYEEWECYKEFLNACPHHDFSIWQVVNIFFNDYSHALDTCIVVTAGGTILVKSPNVA